MMRFDRNFLDSNVPPVSEEGSMKKKKKPWHEVTRERPCLVCRKPDWCSYSDDGETYLCRRLSGDAQVPGLEFVKEKTDTSGSTYTVWRKPLGGRSYRVPRRSRPERSVQPAAAKILNQVYRTLLDSLDFAYEFGQQRGLTEQEVEQLNYRKLRKQDRHRAVQGIIDAGLGRHLPQTPGFSRTSRPAEKGGSFWTLNGGEGVLVPVCDKDGLVVGLKLRRTDWNRQPGEPKFRYLSSKKNGGPGPGAPLHVPKFEGDRSTVRITEGEVKADIATIRSDVLTISIPGVGSWQKAIDYLRKATAKQVLIAFDADYDTNDHVRRSLAGMIDEAQSLGVSVEIETWPVEAGKGIDDVLTAGKGDLIRRLVGEDAKAFRESLGGTTETGKPVPSNAAVSRKPILVTPHEAETNRQIINVLSETENLYQWNGRLVEILGLTGLSKDKPRIAEIPAAKLRSIITDNVMFEKEVRKVDETSKTETSVPNACVNAIHQYGEYPSIRHLEGIVESPTLRPDGTVLATAGYDPITRLYYAPSIEFPTIPEQPTLEEIGAAKALLEEVVVDFPFVNTEHRSAWFASLLTSLARHIFDGPSPMFVIDASTRGSGKSLAADVISLIVTGRPMARTCYTRDDKEISKFITAVAMAGDQLLFWDNVGVPFGNPSLDAAATSVVWKGRELGVSKVPEFPFHTIIFATGNNVAIIGDTSRRVLICRLETSEENPEDRTGFRHSDLQGWVRENRCRLVAAALTILRGWFAAGRPRAELSAWGSFQAWSDSIRQAIFWAGWPDPVRPRIELRSSIDNETAAIQALHDALDAVDPNRAGLTAAEILRKATGDVTAPLGSSRREGNQELREAILDFCPTHDGKLPNPQKLGYSLRRIRGRYVKERALVGKPAAHGRSVWLITGGNR
jgi:hypothetical protein